MTVPQRISHGPAERRSNRDRRRRERTNAKGARLSIAQDDEVKAAACGDVSTSGMRLSLDSPPAAGDRIAIIMGPDLVLSGHVVWVQGADCGIAFDQPVDGAITRLPPVAERRIGKGLPVASTRHRAGSVAAACFREGLNVTVVLQDCERKAVLRWTDEQSASFTLVA